MESTKINTAIGEKFYNVGEIAEMVGLSKWTVRQFMRQKRLPAVKIGIAWKCPHSLLMQWVTDNANINQK